jgi:hypothetical protein
MSFNIRDNVLKPGTLIKLEPEAYYMIRNLGGVSHIEPSDSALVIDHSIVTQIEILVQGCFCILDLRGCADRRGEVSFISKVE